MTQEANIFEWAKEEEKIKPILPKIGGLHEVGYVISAGAKDAAQIGEKSNTITCFVPSKCKQGLRLGDPLLIYDYIEGEYFGGVISSIRCPDITREQLETSLFEHFVPTQTLVRHNRFDFLEQGILVDLRLFCTLVNKIETIKKGPVDYCPHPRASVFRPPLKMIAKMLGLPQPGEGINYGPILLGRKPYIDKLTNRLIPYVMRFPLLYEHEMLIGSTGKGKTVLNKILIKQFIEKTGGCVVVLDKHGEYEPLDQPTIDPESPFETKIWNDCGINAGPHKKLRIFKWAHKKCDVPEPRLSYFTIRFNELEPGDLQYYLPALTPQGYVVLPKLLRMFRSAGFTQLFTNFYNWLRKSANQIPETISDARTLQALTRRMNLTLEQGIFDGKELHGLALNDLIKPNQISVVSLNHIADADIATVVAFHVISLVSQWKLTPENATLPVMLVVDEAHNYFPKRSTENSENSDYIDRLISRAKIICKEGRKFKLRMQFTTQRPEEIDLGVLSIVNTVTFFGMTPQQIHSLKRSFELPVSTKSLINLPKRHCIIYSRDNTAQPVTVYIPWPTLRHPV